MTLFIESYRTELNGYDYCGDDDLLEDPYKEFSWKHYRIIEAEEVSDDSLSIRIC